MLDILEIPGILYTSNEAKHRKPESEKIIKDCPTKDSSQVR